MDIEPNLIKIEKLVKSREAININNKLVLRILGYYDMRDFVKAIGDWGYCSDFTYRDYQTMNWQTFLRRFLREEFLD